MTVPIALNEVSGNDIRRNAKQAEDLPDTQAAVLQHSISRLGGQVEVRSENVLMSSAALQPMLKTSTETGEINLVSAHNTPHPSTRSHRGVGSYRYPSRSTHHGLPSRFNPAYTQAYRAISRPAAPQGSPGAGRLFHLPCPSMQGVYEESYGGGFRNYSAYTSQNAEVLRTCRSHGSMRSQAPSFASSRIPLASFQSSRLQSLSSETSARTPGGPGAEDYRETGQAEHGMSSWAATSTSSRSGDETRGVYMHKPARSVDIAVNGHFTPAVMGLRIPRRPLPQSISERSRKYMASKQQSSEILEGSPLRHEEGVSKPKLPVFYDYTEDFGDEEFYSAKGSVASLAEIEENQSMNEDQHVLSGSALQPLPGNNVVSSLAAASDKISLQRSQSVSTEIRSATYSLQNTQPNGVSHELEHVKVEDQRHQRSQPFQTLHHRWVGSKSRDQHEDMHHTVLSILGYQETPGAELQSTDSDGLSMNRGKGADQLSSHEVDDPGTNHSPSGSLSSSQIRSTESDGRDSVMDELPELTRVNNNSSRESAELSKFYADGRIYPLAASPVPSFISLRQRTSDFEGQVNKQERISTALHGNHQHERAIHVSSGPAIMETRMRTTGSGGSPVLLSKASFPWLANEITPFEINSGIRPLSSPSDPLSADIRVLSTPRGIQVDDEQLAIHMHTSRAPADMLLADVERDSLKQLPRFKLKLRRSDVSRTSSPSLNPWHLNKSYPWAAASPDVQVGLPKSEAQPKPLPPAIPRFKLRILRASSSAGKFIRFTRGQSRISGKPGGKLIKSGTSGPLESESVPGAEETLAQRASDHRKTRSSSSHPVQSVTTGNRSKLRSVFSDDSSEHETPSSIRHRLNSLRAKFAASQTFRMQEDLGTSSEGTPLPPSIQMRAIQSAGKQPAKPHLAGAHSKRRRAFEKLIRWLARRKAQASRYCKRPRQQNTRRARATPVTKA